MQTTDKFDFTLVLIIHLNAMGKIIFNVLILIFYLQYISRRCNFDFCLFAS